MSINPISPKVIAAAAGAGAGATVSSLILWIIGVTAYHVPGNALSVNDAIAAVPSTIAGGLALLLVVVGAAIPGYTASDPMRSAASNPDVIAYQTPSGLVVAGDASPIPSGIPVDVKADSTIGQEQANLEPTDEFPAFQADDDDVPTDQGETQV